MKVYQDIQTIVAVGSQPLILAQPPLVYLEIPPLVINMDVQAIILLVNARLFPQGITSWPHPHRISYSILDIAPTLDLAGPKSLDG